MGPCKVKIKCIMSNGHMGPLVREQIDRHECKQFLPATSLAGDNDIIHQKSGILIEVAWKSIIREKR